MALHDAFNHPKQPNFDIHIGHREGHEWEPVMLYKRASAEIRALAAMVDKLVAFLAEAKDLEGPSWASAALAMSREVEKIKSRIGTFSGGRQSHGFKSRAALGHTDDART